MIPIENDLMFASVMRKKKACTQLLQIIFPDKEIDRIEYVGNFDNEEKYVEVEVQKFLQLGPQNKSIRLDLYFKNSDTVYNVELQRSNRGNIARRARAYSSLIDANLLDRGMKYGKLIDSYVIFLCTFDPFDRDRYIYKFQSTCEEEDLCEDNGRYNIYLNTKGSKGHINFDLEELFKYINGGKSAIGMKTNSNAVKTIDGYVKEFNSNDTWRKGAMTLEMLMQDNYDQGVADAEARAEAKAQKEIVKAQEELAKAKEEKAAAEAKAKEEKACNIRNFYFQGLSVENIAKGFSISEDEVRSIISAK